jgi:hypothetical protein
MLSRRSARRPHAALPLFGLILTWGIASPARVDAQSQATQRQIPSSAPAPAPPPAPIAVPPPFSGSTGRPTAPAPAPPPAPTIVPPADAKPTSSLVREILSDESLSSPPAEPPQLPLTYFEPKVVMGPWDTAIESLFGPAEEKDWQPLSLLTFFTEGWDVPFANAPPGTNGAPKQNWQGAPVGVFARVATLDFFYTNHLNNVPGNFLTPNAPFMPVHPFANGNQYTGYTTWFLPLNSRLELLVGTAFITDNRKSPGGGYRGNWGDTGIQARFKLADQRNFSAIFLIGERIPTGKSYNGSDINYITPGLEVWWNFAPKWVVRGGTQINIQTNRPESTNSVYVNQLSLGRYFTDKDAAYLKNLVVYTTASVLSDTSGGAGHYVQDVYIFPGTRFSLDEKDKLGVNFGVQVPVSGPQAYVWQPQFNLTWKW